MSLRIFILAVMITFSFCVALGASAQIGIWPAVRKKVIEFGWNSPTPAYLRDNMANIEKSGFDGVAIKI